MKVVVKRSKLHGKGVFAAKNISTKETIEFCETILISKDEIKYLNKTNLGNYLFSWKGGNFVIALGNGSLYNHSYNPNARYIKKYREGKLKFVTIKKIMKGEEITVNYNGSPESKEKVWFEVKKLIKHTDK